MTPRRIRWLLALLAGLASLLLPACSKTEASARPGAAAAAAPKPKTSLAAQPGAAKPEPKRVPATGPARRHPFVAVLDPARRATIKGEVGSLVLKGTWCRDGEPQAAIQEGSTTHFVREKDQIGGLMVLEIRGGEVVLGSGRRKRILPLYGGLHSEGAEGSR
jgi:hypothetical protein